MKRAKVEWVGHDRDEALSSMKQDLRDRWDIPLSILALGLLGGGIIAHAVTQEVMVSGAHQTSLPLWLFLIPAGVVSLWHLQSIHRLPALGAYIREQWHVWGRLMVIFSLLWFLAHGLTQQTNVFFAFFKWPEFLRYSIMVVLSLGSSITDNVALAAMQAQLILISPIAIWQTRLLLILFTWSGGFTPFGCLQSLALNNSLKLSTGKWFRETLLWSALSLVGGLMGLALIGVFHPTAVSLPK